MGKIGRFFFPWLVAFYKDNLALHSKDFSSTLNFTKFQKLMGWSHWAGDGRDGMK